MTIEWVLSSLIGILAVLIGTLFKMHLSNKAAIAAHDVIIATLIPLDKKIDGLKDTLDKHEEREERQFHEISHNINKLMISVALLRKSPGEKDNG